MLVDAVGGGGYNSFTEAMEPRPTKENTMNRAEKIAFVCSFNNVSDVRVGTYEGRAVGSRAGATMAVGIYFAGTDFAARGVGRVLPVTHLGGNRWFANEDRRSLQEES